ncbi:hypothetical protein PoB_003570300 [Plakobranchus ocellatus]|uniref:Uncharacterized protein n=1 Tax=Plakobranchus ocellatus TaxID=259542 RepID=A0AAV4AQV2_9GAST|nr:hypothetical protein PoB_003570300 [Plakobranchus ocellatus]
MSDVWLILCKASPQQVISGSQALQQTRALAARFKLATVKLVLSTWTSNLRFRFTAGRFTISPPTACPGRSSSFRSPEAFRPFKPCQSKALMVDSNFICDKKLPADLRADLLAAVPSTIRPEHGENKRARRSEKTTSNPFETVIQEISVILLWGRKVVSVQRVCKQLWLKLQAVKSSILPQVRGSSTTARQQIPEPEVVRSGRLIWELQTSVPAAGNIARQQQICGVSGEWSSRTDILKKLQVWLVA